MAQKKTAPAPPQADHAKMTVVSIKMTTQFRDWLAGLADQERITTVQLIEKAVVEYAEKRNHPVAAPKRTEGR